MQEAIPDEIVELDSCSILDGKDHPAAETINTEDIQRDWYAEEKKCEKSKWKKVINKSKRARGEKYVGRKYTSAKEYVLEEKQEKQLSQRCD